MTRTITTYRMRVPDDNEEWQTTSASVAEEWSRDGAVVTATTRSVN